MHIVHEAVFLTLLHSLNIMSYLYIKSNGIMLNRQAKEFSVGPVFEMTKNETNVKKTPGIWPGVTFTAFVNFLNGVSDNLLQLRCS